MSAARGVTLFKNVGFSFHVSNDEADSSFLGFDALGKLELNKCSGEIVFLVVGLEIDITLQIVGKESQTELESD